jgi:hypothetical protein
MEASNTAPLNRGIVPQEVPSSGSPTAPQLKAHKIVDKSYITHKVFSKMGNNYSFETKPGSNKYKWTLLRNSIKKGDLIEIGDLRIDRNLPPEHKKNQPQLAVGHLRNYLKLLRLEKADQNPTVYVDVTSLFNTISTQALKKEFPAIIEVENEPLGKKQYILPCKQNPKFSAGNLPEDLQGVADITKRLPSDLVGYMDMYLMNEIEFGSEKIDLQQQKEILAQLEDLCNKKAQDALEILLKNYQNGLVFPDTNNPALHPLKKDSIELLLPLRERVTSLDLSHCHLPNDGLLQIATFFPNLKSLKISEVNDSILQQLHSFPQLESLSFSETRDQFTAQKLANLPTTLKRLSFNYCKLSDEAIAGLKELEHLEELNLSDVNVSGENFHLLPISLKKLNFNNCFFLKDKVIVELKDFKNLQELVLRNTNVTGENFHLLPISLKKLNCHNCSKLRDEALAELQDFKNLQELDLIGTKVTGKNFHLLPNSLKKLDCYGCRNLTGEAIAGLTHCENLQELDLSYTNVSGENFHLLPISLNKLNCRCCDNLIDKAIAGLTHCENLQELILSHANVTEENLYFLPISLKKLHCDSCNNLTDTAIAGLTHCKNLQELILSFTKVTGETIPLLPTSLKKLDCNMCRLLKDNAIAMLLHYKNLQEIILSGKSYRRKLPLTSHFIE